MPRKAKRKAKRRKKRPPYKYRAMSDDEVLGLINDGTLQVDTEAAEVKKLRRGGKWKKLATFEGGRERARYLFVRIYHNKGRKGIPLARLVWMAGHRRTVPDGHDVDHEDTDRRNCSLSNLRLLTSAVNRGRHHHANEF